MRRLSILLVFAAHAASATGIATINHSELSRKATTTGEVRIERVVDVDPGERIVVVIDSTFPTLYQYDLAGVEKAPADTSGFMQNPSPPPVSVTLSEFHRAEYGGYVLRVKALPNQARGKLRDLVVFIRVVDMDWRAEFSGGFTISTLTDRKYGLINDEENAGQNIVTREEDRESTVRPGFASFVHLSHPQFGLPRYNPQTGTSDRTIPMALSFGLGVDPNLKQADLFIGPSILFGNAGSFTIGLSFGGVDTAPPGLPVGSSTSESNALATLPTRVAVGGFFGLTYTFAGGGAREALTKPYKATAAPTPTE